MDKYMKCLNDVIASFKENKLNKDMALGMVNGITLVSTLDKDINIEEFSDILLKSEEAQRILQGWE